MAYKPRSTYKYNKYQARKKLAKFRKSRKLKYYKAKSQGTKIFTETVSVQDMTLQNGTIDPSTNAPLPGQLWSISMADLKQTTVNSGLPSNQTITQFDAYKRLYRKFKIIKLQWMFVPLWNGADVNQYNLNATNNQTTSSNIRAAFAQISTGYSDTSGGYVLPQNELDVLQSQGSFIKLMQDKPFKITNYGPKPLTLQQSVNDGVVAPTNIGSMQNQYFSFDADTFPQMGGLITYSTCEGFKSSPGVAPATVATNVANVYCKITFCVKDPR